MHERSSSGISLGFETLISRQKKRSKLDNKHSASSNNNVDNTHHDYDVIIIGSGYGGSIAASELSSLSENNKPLRICLLERGSEYLPGMFPSRMAELPAHVRINTTKTTLNNTNYQKKREGLFDIHISPHLNTLVANGLGGGSLINAGVMLEAAPSVFDYRWPSDLQSSSQSNLFSGYYEEAKQKLGAKTSHNDNTIERHAQHQQKTLLKYQALKNIAEDTSNTQPFKRFSAVPLTIAMEDKENSAGVMLNACNLCGDCTTGCNHNAKESLDTNLLVNAWRRGVEIYTGATALSISPCETSNKGWNLSVIHTKKQLQKRESNVTILSAKRIILAAGTLGSSEILMRSQSQKLKFSKQLGQRFSSNGDMLSAAFNQNNTANAIANEDIPPDERQVGPAITSRIDMRDSTGQSILIEEIAVPSPLYRLFEEVSTTIHSLSMLTTADKEKHKSGNPKQDPFAINTKAINNTSAFVLMGNDGAKGSLKWSSNNPENRNKSDGNIQIHWPALSNHQIFSDQIDTLKKLIKKSKTGGDLLKNPIWNLPFNNLSENTGQKKGTLITVHPLGGCAMADNCDKGVVDHIGRVYDASKSSTGNITHGGLIVLDGAMIPSALEVNPALTIAAIAFRSIHLLEKQWGLSANKALENTTSSQKYPTRYIRDHQVNRKKHTRIEINERLQGHIVLTDKNQRPINSIIDITLRFNDFSIRDFTHNNLRELTVNDEQTANGSDSKLRIFNQETWQQLTEQGANEEEFDQQALLISDISGTLNIMSREASSPLSRIMRILWPWLRNRGFRDLWESAESKIKNLPITTFYDKKYTKRDHDSGILKKLKEFLSLSSRGGEVRIFSYKLSLIKPNSGWPKHISGFDNNAQNVELEGFKKIHYTRRGNPFRQFEKLHLTKFPGLQTSKDIYRKRPATLRFDPNFSSAYDKPLISIVDQEDQPTALMDITGFLNYFLRAIINIHFHSFLKPGNPQKAVINRLPGHIAGVTTPVITTLEIETSSSSSKKTLVVPVRLTRYKNVTSNRPPVVMIHGYSASGSTFTNTTLNPSLAQYFWNKGRDVWVVDLRTSSAMPSALQPWSFEDVAFEDIPVIVEHICQKTQQDKIDVIAHCMGSTMLSIAILSRPEKNHRYYKERLQLHKRINKVVLSQVGPEVVFSSENIFRAYMLNYLQHIIPSVSYSFMRTESPTHAEDILDFLLSSLPYPDEEFDLENPLLPWKKTHFRTTRRRIDALYGRSFSLANLSEDTLLHINDFFGPLNFSTLTRVIDFATHEKVTNKYGENEYVTNENLQSFWKFPTLSIHGSENGLSNVTTLNRMQQTMTAAGCDFHTEILQGFGHQDSLIGKNSIVNFHKISDFFDKEHKEKCEPAEHPQRFHCETPYSGPVIGTQSKSNKIAVSLGINPQRMRPDFIVFIAINVNRDKIELAHCDMPLHHNLSMTFTSPIQQNWIKTELPITPQFENSDGVLVLLLDDQHINWDEISCPTCLPDNLLDLVDKNTEITPDAQQIREYLRLNILSNGFIQAIKNTLNQSKNILESAIIQWPKRQKSQQKLQHEEQQEVQQEVQQTQFALAACQYPAGLLDKKLAYASYQRLANRLDKNKTCTPKNLTPQFFVLMGDQVYTDASAGLFDPTDSHDRFTRPYHKWLSQPSVKSVFRRLPSFMMLDDHEILNNWDRSELTLGNAKLFQYGKKAYLNFQRNLHQTPQSNDTNINDIPLWYSFEQQDFDFFMLDTRTERDGRSIKNNVSSHHIKPLMEAKLISDIQFQALIDWLERTKTNTGRPRFITSASMLLPRRLHSRGNNNTNHSYNAIHSDAWDGYPRTMHQLLEYIALNDVKNLVFLSGDEHVSNVTTIDLTSTSMVLEKTTSTRIYSIHSSGLYSPYPFANSNPSDFAKKDTFNIGESDILCQISSTFYPGDGFALISAYQMEDAWHISSDFSRAGKTPESAEDVISWSAEL